MSISDKTAWRARVRDLIKEEEGFVPHVYRDTEGYETIGYGFLVDGRAWGGIPKPIAEKWLDYEIDEVESTLRHHIPNLDSFPEPVVLALFSMSYQLGVGGVLNFTDMMAALQRGDYAVAANEALDSVWATEQTPERARRMADLIRSAL